jgi:Protein of unknown function (DUF2786)
MAMTPERKRLADRILKLLALASSTSFAAEAETARTMAADLMRAHNISLGPGKPSQDTIECREHVPYAKGTRWEGIIVGSLADLCSCTIFFNSRRLDHYALVGAIGNLDILDYMVREIARQRIAAWMNYKMSGEPDSFHKFCYGFAQALSSKIKTLIDQQQLGKNRAQLTLWYETNILHGPTAEPFCLSSGRASSEAGMDAGQNASLHRGSLGQPIRQIGRR